MRRSPGGTRRAPPASRQQAGRNRRSRGAARARFAIYLIGMSVGVFTYLEADVADSWTHEGTINGERRSHSQYASGMMEEETPVKTTHTDLLEIAFEEGGPDHGRPVLLLHGWPDAPCGWNGIAPQLHAAGWRRIAPYLRGSGPTRFLSDKTPRVGAGLALAQDAVDTPAPSPPARVAVLTIAPNNLANQPTNPDLPARSGAWMADQVSQAIEHAASGQTQGPRRCPA